MSANRSGSSLHDLGRLSALCVSLLGDLIAPSRGFYRATLVTSHAPVGAALAYPYSLHIYATAGLHRAITWVRPHFPLEATAQLLPLVVAVLGVVPAFFLGRRLAGTLGGLVAAATIALHPPTLERSLGGDNDVWNLVLPLYLVWAATGTFSGPWWRRALFAVLAGAVAGLHATIWKGWILGYVVVLTGLLAYLAILSARAVRETGSWRVWPAFFS